MPKKDKEHAETMWEMKVALEKEAQINPYIHLEPKGSDIELTGPIRNGPIKSIRFTPNCRSVSKKERNAFLELLKLIGITVEIFIIVGGWSHFFLHL